MAYAQSCVAGDPIGNFPFTPGVDNTFRPGDSRVTNADFNGVVGDVLSFQANPGGADQQIQLVRSANNATVIATITFAASTTYTVTAADAAQFPYQMRITNNSTVNQTYVINCTAAPPPSAPTVTAIAPISGTTAGGTPVTITGTNFTSATAVTIGGLAATPFTVVNSTTITTTTPAHAPGAVNIVVTTPNGPGTGVGLFTYIAPPAAPTVTVIVPNSGPIAGGTAVTITGTNFTGATAVTIGGVAATGVNVVNATTITAITGAHAAGIVDVAVTANGTGTGVGLFTYVAPPSAPTITAIAPARGTTAGGTPVTITGTDFTGATAVSIGGVPATTFTVLSATSISATTGAHAAGIVDVVVTTPNGTGTGAGLFTYVAPVAPNVTAISPSSGPTSGGTPVTITGTAFIGATSVTIGGVAAPFTVVNASTINATTGPRSAGAVDVAVTTPGGTGTGVGLFTYVAPPTVTAISPNSGSTAGGTDVTITGADFTGATAVTIGGVAAPFTVVNATTITATTGAHGAGVVDVAVTTLGGAGTGSGLFTYVAPPGAPNVASISPSDGPIAGGTAVTITGTNFTGATAVSIGGIAAASFTVVNDTSISATTPAHAAGAVDVVVTTPGGVGTGVGLFTYIAPPPVPTVTSISPISGATAGGTAVTITGTNFTGATAVVIGAVPVTSFTVVDATTITANTGPRAAGLVGVGVTTPGGTGILPNSFTYVAPPTVTAIDPVGGTIEGGTVVTITGTNFTGATAVTIGGLTASFTVSDATTITATTPAHAAGAVDVAVTTPGGVGTGAGLFTYIAPPAAPTVEAINPNSGTTAGGTVVTITGTNFTGATAVSIGGVAATGVTVVSTTSITATTPAHAAGAVNVDVTTPGGVGTGVGLFTYIAPPAAPTVAAISPASGPTGGGTAITITGANFTGATAVSIGGIAANSFTVVNDTTITATTGAHAAGVVDVAVTTAGGAGTGSGLYTYVEVQTVPTKTIELIGGFLGRRNTLIASNEPDSNREIDRLMEAERASGGSSVAPEPRFGADRGALALGGAAFSANPWDRRSDSDIGPPRIGGDLELPRNWQFSTSLRDIANRYANAEARRAAAAGLGAREGAGASRANPFDVWIEGTYASFGDRDSLSDLDGHFGLLALGADYVVNPGLLLGAMAQFDSMSQHSDAEATDVEGQGWMVGPYATMRLGDNVFWRVRAAWGQSSNDVSPFLTYTDHFDSQRWLVSSRLTGNLIAGRWTIRPSASVFYMEDVADGYTDGSGAAVPEISSRLGQIEAGPEISYRYELDDIQLEPRAGVSIAATFANEANAPGFGQIDGELVGPDGVRTRAELGLSATTRGGLAVDLSGAYDGIGSESFEAYSASLRLRLPLN